MDELFVHRKILLADFQKYINLVHYEKYGC